MAEKCIKDEEKLNTAHGFIGRLTRMDAEHQWHAWVPRPHPTC